MFADHLHRMRIYKPDECQFLSFWANRDHPGRYFSFKSNELMLKGLIEDLKKKSKDIRLLLVDDNLIGGDTSRQAIDFIRGYYKDIHVRFLPLFFNRSEVLLRIYEYILWTHHAFQYDEHKMLNLHLVHYREFPYGKAISGH